MSSRAFKSAAVSTVFSYFERLVDPYPDAPPPAPPRTFGAFIWATTAGTRRYIAAMTLFTAAIGALEALLFAMLARVLDWLASAQPQPFGREHGGTLALLALVLVSSIGLALLQSLFKRQTLADNLLMCLRGNFHRLMLAQSMSSLNLTRSVARPDHICRNRCR